MITMDALGSLDRFGRVFDLDYYQANKAAISETVRRKGSKGSELDRAAYELYAAAVATTAS